MTTTYDIAAGRSLVQGVKRLGAGEALDLDAALAEGRALAPLDHPDPAHLHLTGTGLTHLGSADAHVHFFGTATLSFGDGLRAKPGDVFEIAAEGFGRPLWMAVAVAAPGETPVRTL